MFPHLAPLSGSQSPHDLSRNALAGFFGIAERWGLDNAQARALLGEPAPRTFFKWKKGDAGVVPGDVLRRIGYVSAIWKALQIVYQDPAMADTWVARPNRAFGGQTPLERMCAGDVTDLAIVRDYLDSARSPWS
ncbi:MAG: MbcA/ParS/Xre antitoxin family protein [Vicinamibacterales bacterium]